MSGRALTRRRALGTIGGLTLTGLAGCSAPGGFGGTAPTSPPPTADGDDGTEESPTPTPPDPGPLALRPVATGFDVPLDLADPAGADWRYVADRSGLLSAVGAEGGVEPALDLRDRVVTDRSEQGLLGIALHPDFAANRRLFVRYSAPRRDGTPEAYSHTFVLAEFEASADGPAVDRDSERTILEVPEPQWNHNAGSIAFGPDELLYVGVGDGGAGGDRGRGHVEGGNGQDVAANLLGSILRIDVDGRSGERAYAIPGDNPLVGRDGLDEHYAWGFRNPWRMSFDGEDLYAGDVGQNAYEEVDRVVAGGNYGWNVREGAHCYGAETCPVETAGGEPFVRPVVEYPHGGAPVSGRSVIGGYVYRGDALPGLEGRYVFGDLYAGGRLFVAERTDGEGRWPTANVPLVEADRPKLDQLYSFGRDPAGRLFVLGGGRDGGVYELVAGG